MQHVARRQYLPRVLENILYTPQSTLHSLSVSALYIIRLLLNGGQNVKIECFNFVTGLDISKLQSGYNILLSSESKYCQQLV